ncbi:MAG TPA: extracellular solute-binding protein [Acidimicrobiales bacterium]|nr:extracellular solute-binding protein [Acidimicrobiales bacterium]
MRKMTRAGSLAGFVGLLLACPLLAGCGGGGSAGAPSITLYNGQHVQTTEALVKMFEKQTGIQVNVRNDDEDVFANQIVQEGANSPADVIYTENSPPLEVLQERGLLAAVSASSLAKVAPRYSSPRGEWIGVSARSSVMVYNTDLLKADELPRSVMDLAQPRWRDKLALAPGETDFQPIVTSIALKYGKAAALAWLQGVKANAANHIYPDNETLTNMVNRGQAVIGIINHYYWYRQSYQVGAAKVHSAIAYFAPGDAGWVIDVSGAGVLKSSRHQQAAERFVAFLVSKDGEEIIAHSQSYEYPLGSGVVTTKNLRPFDTLHPAPVSVTQLGDGSTAIALLQEAQLL